MILDPAVRRLRSSLALLIVFASMCGTAPMLRASDGGVILALALAVALPFAVVLVAGHSPWPFGMAAAASMPISMLVQSVAWPPASGAADALIPVSICAGFSIILGVMGTAMAEAVTGRLDARRERRRRGHFCLRCDYDLTANVSGVCPECGTRVTAATPRDPHGKRDA